MTAVELDATHVERRGPCDRLERRQIMGSIEEQGRDLRRLTWILLTVLVEICQLAGSHNFPGSSPRARKTSRSVLV